MKVKKKEVGLLIILLGILSAFASYWFAYRNYEAKAAEINTKNEELQATVDRLEILEARKSEYLESMEMMQAADTEIINSFAPGVLREDQIMYLYNMELVDSNEIRVPAVSMSPGQAVPYTGPTSEDGYELVDDGIALYRMDSSVGFMTTNNGLKSVLNYIYDLDSRKSISTVNVRVSNDGYLEGSMQLSFYYLAGTDRPYVEPKIQGVPTGTSNFFGALTGGEYSDDEPGAVTGDEEGEEDEGSPEDEGGSEENDQ